MFPHFFFLLCIIQVRPFVITGLSILPDQSFTVGWTVRIKLKFLHSENHRFTLLYYGGITVSSLRCASNSIQPISSHSALVLTHTGNLSSAFLFHFIKT